MRFYSALYSNCYPFDEFYPESEFLTVAKPEQLEAPGILIIWGGGDIHPSIYGKPNLGSHVGQQESARDLTEVALFKRAIEIQMPVIGICRGAQLGCALAGGILIQDFPGHEHSHPIETNDGRKMGTSSLHHQVMFPWRIKHELIAWDARPNDYHPIFIESIDEFDLIRWSSYRYDVPEIVYFPAIRCLAIQGHPEFMARYTQFVRYTKELCDKYAAY